MTMEFAESNASLTLADSEPKPPFPAVKYNRPSLESDLIPQPRYEGSKYKPAGKLDGKCALITGGDSGIGRSVAYFFAREGADVAINFLAEERSDAESLRGMIEELGRRCILLPGDLTAEGFCEELIDNALKKLGKIDILVSNAAHQTRKSNLESITDEEWQKTFHTNVFAMLKLSKRVLPHLERGSSIIVTSSETGLFGSERLIDYSATKGAINAFVKALAHNVVERGIRVNAVAPGPVWTPLNPSDDGFSQQEVAAFGQKTQFKRPAQPEEIAPAYVFFASEADSSFITGHILPVVGDQTSG